MRSLGRSPEFRWWDALLGLLAGLLVVGAWVSGLAVNVVNGALIVGVPVALVSRVVAAARGKLALGFVRGPLAPEHRWFLVQALVRWLFLAVWALVLHATIVPQQLGDQLASIWILLVAVLVCHGLLPLFPRQRVLAARLAGVALLAVFFAVQLVAAKVPISSSDVTLIDSPFRGEALALQAGSSPLTNHHFLFRGQRHAIDLVALDRGKLVNGDEAALTSHACFGQPVHAPLPGTVVEIVNDRPDMEYGESDREQIAGNQVVLRVAPERYVLLAHLKRGSIVVERGQRVACGDVLAQCGNSGNTSAPHLHLQLQNRAEFSDPELRTYPIAFRNAVLVRGADHLQAPAVPRRSDGVRPRGAACR